MRFVVHDIDGVVVLNNMWLPVWISCSPAIMKSVEDELRKLAIGRELTEKTLDELHVAVIDYIQSAFGRPGLWKYLDAVKYVDG